MSPTEATFMEYARESGGGMYADRRQYAWGGGGAPCFKVQIRLGNWVAELNASDAYLRTTTATMSAEYETPDGFYFKVKRKGFLHDFLGRLFGSRDVDVEDLKLQNDWFVEANDADRVRQLFADEEFRQNILERLTLPPPRFRKLEARRKGSRGHAEVSFDFKLDADVTASVAYAMTSHETLHWLLGRLAVPRDVPKALLAPGYPWELVVEPEPECLLHHSSLTPHWETVQDMGNQDRVSYYRCELCGNTFSRSEGEHLLKEGRERLRRSAGG